MILMAIRDGDARTIVAVSSMVVAEKVVEDMEADETWPEGFDAMIVCTNDGCEWYLDADGGAWIPAEHNSRLATEQEIGK